MDRDHIKRMYLEGKARISDANILSKHITQSDSASFLRVLGFEVLLKCALFANGQKLKGHIYSDLWLELPNYAQNKIMNDAKDRMAGHVDFSSLDKILNAYQVVFEKARYFYEFYEGYTLEEQHELGKFWVEIGAPVKEADIQYYPNELEGLIYGLSNYIEEKLSRK